MQYPSPHESALHNDDLERVQKFLPRFSAANLPYYLNQDLICFAVELSCLCLSISHSFNRLNFRSPEVIFIATVFRFRLNNCWTCTLTKVLYLFYKILMLMSETTMEDQKKRTLDALERRFAQSKEEFYAQQQKGRKRPVEDKDRVTSNIESSSADNVVKKPFSKASSRKGNISFSGHNSKQDVEVNEPAYFEVSHSVHENLLSTCIKASDKKFKVDCILHELFQHGDSAQKYMQGSKTMKIESTILLDNYLRKSLKSNRSRMQALQNFSKRSKKHMSLKQHKRRGSFDLPEEFHDFEIFKPMHEKWKAYILQLLKIVGKDQLAPCFLNADLHGAIILVVQCKIVAYIGIHGIMVRETEETFGIITQDNKFRVVPKKLSVFMLQAECWKITLHGDKLGSRNLVPRS